MIPLLLTLLLASASPVPADIPVPADAVHEPDLTKAANARAQVEVKAALAQLEGDASIPKDRKEELRRKIQRLKLNVYTTPKSFADTVAFYEQASGVVRFQFGDRSVLDDAQEVARSGGFTVPSATVAEWTGKRARSARWSSDDGSLEIDIEDHLVDPRDASIRQRTVILLTTTR